MKDTIIDLGGKERFIVNPEGRVGFEGNVVVAAKAVGAKLAAGKTIEFSKGSFLGKADDGDEIVYVGGTYSDQALQVMGVLGAKRGRTESEAGKAPKPKPDRDAEEAKDAKGAKK